MRRPKENIFVIAAAFICIVLVFAARHHPPSRRKIKEIWHGRVYWEGESNTTMLRSSPEKALENVEPTEVNETPTNLDELTVTPPKIVVTESTNQDDTSEVAQSVKNTDTPSQSDSKNIILTSVYHYHKDPQRGRTIKCGFDYIANFYNSVYFYRMRAVIMHDCYSEQFVKQHETDKIAFVHINSLDNSLSTNDFRFKRYKSYLKENRHDYYMFVDASDVFFNGNPFNYMKNHEHGHTLFMSPDIGNFHKNAWQVKKCYKEAGRLWDQNVKMHNAGVWGGDHQTSQCILKCVTNQFETTLKGINNCNMPALNWCVHFGGCTDENTVEDNPDFVNPFRKECRHSHLVVHNKCKDTEGKVCLIQQGDKLALVPKQRECQKLSLRQENPNSKNHVYIDLGARDGDTMKALRSQYAKCIAFEPNPTMFNKLIRNKYPRCAEVKFYKAAAWIRDGRITFYEDKRSKNQWGSSLVKRPDMKDSQRIKIEVDSIDIVETIRNEFSNAIVLKIDIEGAEYELITHLLQYPDVFQKVQHVLVEWHGRYMPNERGRESILENQIKQLGIQIFKKPVVETLQQHEDPFDYVKTKQKCAIVSYISTTNFLECMRVLAYSVKKTTKYPFIVAILDTVDKKQREYIKSEMPGVQIKYWKQVKNPHKRLTNSHFKNNYAVLNMWEMVEYDRVVAIDADMLVTQSLDHLCEMEVQPDAVAAANIYWTARKKWDPSGFNAGLMVLTPSTQLARELKNAAIAFSTSTKNLDSSRNYSAAYRSWYSSSTGVNPFLNYFFNENNKWIKLNPKIWGINANSFEPRSESWDDSKIHAIHYTTKAKPCHTSPGSFITKSFNHPYRHWHRVFDKMRRDKFKGSLHIINNDINKKVSTDYEKYMDMQTSQALESDPGYDKYVNTRKACVLYLLTKESGPTGKNYVKLISKSIASLEKYFFTTVRYPICIIHTPDIIQSDLNDISKQTKSEIFAYEIDFSYPLHKKATYNRKTPTAPKCVSRYNPNKEWNINYLHMCHFFTSTVFHHPVFKDFDWIIRLDADSGLDLPIPCDPISIMETTGSIFGYYKKEKQGGGCAKGLHTAIKNDFLPKTKMALNFNVKANDVYLGAFHIFKTSEFIKPNIMKFWDWLDLKSFSYEMRTGEQAVMPYALALMTSEDKIHQFSGYGLWHRLESNKLWRTRLNIPTKCNLIKEDSIVEEESDSIVEEDSDSIVEAEWSSQPIPNKNAPCTPSNTNIHSTFSNKITKKWERCQGHTPPRLFLKQNINRVVTESPKDNIVVILIDALSRAHAMRTLSKSMKWLRENNGVSLGRYHITGFHSEENQTPLMTGSEYKSQLGTTLPTIAKKMGYLTQYASIADRVAKVCSRKLFDYWNVGKEWSFDKDRGFCNGNAQTSEMTLQSIVDFFTAYPKIPKFSYSYLLESHWWHPVSTDGIYSTLLDDPLLTFFERLPELERTTIIIMSDHGSNFWEQRSIHPEVSYEHKLPLAVIKNPRKNNLHANKWKLTTPYDMHASIVGIMGGKSNRGTNIFQDIIPDTKTCSESGIPNEFCLCSLSENKDPTKPMLDATMKYINERGHGRDSKRCLALSFKDYVEPSIRVHGGGPGEFIYKFTFQTTFDRVFEASVYHTTLKDAKKKKITVQYVKQLSQYDNMRKCLKHMEQNNKLPEVEFCVCGTSKIESEEHVENKNSEEIIQ